MTNNNEQLWKQEQQENSQAPNGSQNNNLFLQQLKQKSPESKAKENYPALEN